MTSPHVQIPFVQNLSRIGKTPIRRVHHASNEIRDLETERRRHTMAMVQKTGETSNLSAPLSLLDELEDWQRYLNSQPEVIHKLAAFKAAVDCDQDRKPNTTSPQPGPVTDLCRSCDHVSCRKGEHRWHHDRSMNSAPQLRALELPRFRGQFQCH